MTYDQKLQLNNKDPIKKMDFFLRSPEFITLSNTLKNINELSEIKKFYDNLELELFKYFDFEIDFKPSLDIITNYRNLLINHSDFHLGCIDKGRLVLVVLILKLMRLTACPEKEIELFIKQYIQG